MRVGETVTCCKCGARMHEIRGSDRTVRERTWVTFRCPSCGHREMDWYYTKEYLGK